MDKKNVDEFFKILSEIENNFKITKLKFAELVEDSKGYQNLSKENFDKLYNIVYDKYDKFDKYMTDQVEKHIKIFDSITKDENLLEYIQSNFLEKYNKYSSSIHQLSIEIEEIQNKNEEMFFEEDYGAWFDIGLRCGNLESYIEDLVTYRLAINLWN